MITLCQYWNFVVKPLCGICKLVGKVTRHALPGACSPEKNSCPQEIKSVIALIYFSTSPPPAKKIFTPPPRIYLAPSSIPCLDVVLHEYLSSVNLPLSLRPWSMDFWQKIICLVQSAKLLYSLVCDALFSNWQRLNFGQNCIFQTFKRLASILGVQLSNKILFFVLYAKDYLCTSFSCNLEKHLFFVTWEFNVRNKQLWKKNRWGRMINVSGNEKRYLVPKIEFNRCLCSRYKEHIYQSLHEASSRIFQNQQIKKPITQVGGVGSNSLFAWRFYDSTTDFSSRWFQGYGMILQKSWNSELWDSCTPSTRESGWNLKVLSFWPLKGFTQFYGRILSGLYPCIISVSSGLLRSNEAVYVKGGGCCHLPRVLAPPQPTSPLSTHTCTHRQEHTLRQLVILVPFICSKR